MKSKKSKSMKSKKSTGRCESSNLKKYINRPGPPYPAQNCKNHEKKGNDGKMYKSTSNKNGIFSWKLI